MDPTDLKYNVNQDVFDGRLVDEDELSSEQVEEVAATGKDLIVEEGVTMGGIPL